MSRAILLLAFIITGCTESAAKVTQRDIVGLYVGIGYEGVAPHPAPVRMQLFADGSFIGDLGVPDGFVRHSGRWQLGTPDTTHGCRNVDFWVGGARAGKYCFSIGQDNITGINCYRALDGRDPCLMQRRADRDGVNRFDLAPITEKASRTPSG